ncbi:chitinase-3-like protein 1 [Orussus abietinus]|uniref:chitinase-3-like protein 1 n=1 Tax=Orussus abietinus TaxID=222816 RepID=UPI000626706A|nr:chitinase-3-like protein 1 [Orussus abietinus]
MCHIPATLLSRIKPSLSRFNISQSLRSTDLETHSPSGLFFGNCTNARALFWMSQDLLKRNKNSRETNPRQFRWKALEMRGLLLAVLAAFAAVAAGEKKIVCYYGSWAVYRPGNGKFDISYIDPTLCTHMIYTFVGISEQGEVKILDAWNDLPNDYGKDGFGKFNRLKQLSPTTKTLVAIGGWNEGSIKYSAVMKNPSLRSTFVNNVVNFVEKYGFDGFDVDWEYPAQRGGSAEDVQNFVQLLKELKARLAPKGLLLSAAVGAAESSASQSYDIKAISQHLDFINLMTYDLHGSWEKTIGINAPLKPRSDEHGFQRSLNVEAAVNYWLSQGADPQKLILGTPLYGRSFTLGDPNRVTPGSPARGPGDRGIYTKEAGMLGYNEICELLPSWTSQWDEEQQVPYAYSGDQWVGYDNVRSIELKAKFVLEKNLGGAMLWSIDTDDFLGKCGTQYPLLKALNHVLRNGPAVPVEPNPPASPVTNKPQYTSTQPSYPSNPGKPPGSSTGGLCSAQGYVRDPVDCSKFYYCNFAGEQQPAEFRCPGELAFDPAQNVCNYADQVQC